MKGREKLIKHLKENVEALWSKKEEDGEVDDEKDWQRYEKEKRKTVTMEMWMPDGQTQCKETIAVLSSDWKLD